MTTALCVLGAALVLAILIAVLVQMCGSFTMWVFHLCCGTVSGLLQVLAFLAEAIFEGLKGASS